MSRKHAALPPPPDPALAHRRYHSLDGLRGVAAMVVVVCHLLLVVTVFATAQAASAAPTFSLAWWIYKTPLQDLFAGQASVLVFFVLSGFVLALPLRPTVRGTGATSWRWGPYYVRRLLRLYVPVWASILLATGLAIVVTRDQHSSNPWIASHPGPTPTRVARDFLLLSGTSNLNSPLWSLRWEMWFSLLLPVLVFLIALMRMQRWWPAAILLLAALSASAKFPSVEAALPGAFITVGLLQYLPIFGIGILLAFDLPSLHALGSLLHRSRRSPIVFTVLTLAVVLLVAWPTMRAKDPGYDIGTAVAAFGSVIAMPIVIFLAIEARPLVRFLETRPLQWLGSRSFSIYLVHEPLVVAVGLLVHPEGILLWLLISAALLPVLLLISNLFFRFVERPAHHLSRRAGSALERHLPQIGAKPVEIASAGQKTVVEKIS